MQKRRKPAGGEGVGHLFPPRSQGFYVEGKDNRKMHREFPGREKRTMCCKLVKGGTPISNEQDERGPGADQPKTTHARKKSVAAETKKRPRTQKKKKKKKRKKKKKKRKKKKQKKTC